MGRFDILRSSQRHSQDHSPRSLQHTPQGFRYDDKGGIHHAVHTVDRILITWASIETVGMTWAFVDTQSILSHTHADAVVLIFTFRVAT